MRLVTYDKGGNATLGARKDDQVVDLSDVAPDMRAYLDGGDRTRKDAEAAISTGAGATDAGGVKILAPIQNPEKIICIGLNYADHAEESGMAIPEEPIVFSKYASTIIGPGDEIRVPPSSSKTDYEVELVVVIGKRGKDISEADALDHVGGYTIGHDVSARDYQLEKPGGQWMLGKTFDTFAPIGPEIVTSDEVGDPHALGIRCILNGDTVQDSTTAQLIFKVPQLVAYLSHVFTLAPGDLIFTGTPPGVGMARDPQLWLKPGDTVVCEVDGLGRLENHCV
jgi:2-keto-4-pentenoate hydratase/2-oxohepta-3-ene-1,7-dioic acid hydratase in catechol pathway